MFKFKVSIKIDCWILMKALAKMGFPEGTLKVSQK
jgi:hypothetical protein